MARENTEKRAPGRPRLYAEELKRRDIKLTDSQAAALESFGGGNLSAGIRKAAEAVRELIGQQVRS
jgi:hypothetical protein